MAETDIKKETSSNGSVDKGPNLGATKQDKDLYGSDFDKAFSTALSFGENPSQKCLVQHIYKAGDNYDQCKELYDLVCGGEEFVAVGNKIEYILTNQTVVNKFDKSQFIANISDILNPSEHTYVDDILIPEIDWESTLTPQYKPTLYQWTLKSYYLSGLNIEQIRSLVTAPGKEMIFKYKFKTFMYWLKYIYDYLKTKTETTKADNIVSNNFVDKESSAVDMFENFQLFVKTISSVSNKYMLGKVKTHFDSETHEQVVEGIEPFEGAYNKANISDLVFLTDEKTLLAIKKWLAMLPQGVNSLINISQFKTLPLTYLDVHKPTMTPNDLPDIASTQGFFTKDNVYQPGTILILQKGYLKSVYNYEYHGSEEYKKNISYQLLSMQNYNMKPLKFMICGIYQNPNIQEQFSVPVSVSGSDSDPDNKKN